MANVERAKEPNKKELLEDLELTIAGVVDDVLTIKLEAMEDLLNRKVADKLSQLSEQQKGLMERLNGLVGPSPVSGSAVPPARIRELEERCASLEQAVSQAEAGRSRAENSAQAVAARSDESKEIRARLETATTELEALRSQQGTHRERDKALSDERKRLQDHLLKVMAESDEFKKKYDELRRTSGGGSIKTPDGRTLSAQQAETLLRDMGDRLQRAMTDTESLQNTVQAQKQSEDRFQESYARLENELHETRRALNEAGRGGRQLASRQEELDHQRAENRELKQHLAHASADQMKVQRQLQKLSEQAAADASEVAALKASREASEQQIQALQADLEQARTQGQNQDQATSKKLAQLEADKQALESRLETDLQAARTLAEHERTRLKAEFAEERDLLLSEIETARSAGNDGGGTPDVAALEAELATIRQDCERLRDGADATLALEAELTALQSEHARLREQMGASEALEAEIVALRAENERLSRKKAGGEPAADSVRLTNELEVLNKSYKSTVEKLAQAEQQQKALQDDLAASQAECSALTMQVKAGQAETRSVLESASDASRQSDRLKQERGRWEAEMKALQAKLDDPERERQMRNLKDEAATLRQAAIDAQTETETLRQKLARADTERENVQKMLDTSIDPELLRNSKIRELQGRLEEGQHTMRDKDRLLDEAYKEKILLREELEKEQREKYERVQMYERERRQLTEKLGDLTRSYEKERQEKEACVTELTRITGKKKWLFG